MMQCRKGIRLLDAPTAWHQCNNAMAAKRRGIAILTALLGQIQWQGRCLLSSCYQTSSYMNLQFVGLGFEMYPHTEAFNGHEKRQVREPL